MARTSIEYPDVVRDNHRLINTATYLSSLASSQDDIDPMLDTLRDITSSWDLKTPLSPPKKTELEGLIADLKDYLVKRDPIRSFTNETLEARVEAELAGGGGTLQLSALMAWCFLPPLAVALLPSSLTITNHVYLTVTTLLVTLLTATVWLYLSSLRNFKLELRTTFLYISASAIFISVTCLHYAAIGIFNLADLPLFRYGGFTPVAMVGLGFLFLAATKYAQILKIPTATLTKQLVVVSLLIVPIAIGVAVLRGVPDLFFFNLALIPMLITSLFGLFGARVTHRLLKSVTAYYAKSLRVLYIFQIAAAVTAFLFAIALVWLGHLSVGELGLLIIVSALPTLALFMYSGYSFKKETSR
jgi:hypothetical protein